MKKELFISRLPESHLKDYQYDLLPDEFKATDKVRILCNKHGEFIQQANTHRDGSGCPKCKAEKISALNREVDWNSRVAKAFGGKFGHPSEKVISQNQMMRLVCPKHGEFFITPKNFLKSEYGCQKCAKEAVGKASRLKLSTVLNKFKDIHGGIYDYSLISEDSFKFVTDKVDIICPTHGVFSKSIKRHYAGEGCPKCLRLQKSLSKKLDNAARSLDSKGFKYRLIDGDTWVQCHQHGLVKTTGKLIKSGYPCRICYLESKRISVDTWLTRFNKVHNNKYQYRFLSDKPLSQDKVEVTCNAHDKPFVFEQRITDHYLGHGCPRCKLEAASQGVSKLEVTWVDYLKSLGLSVQTQVVVQDNGIVRVLDITCGSTAIEINGLYWHSTKNLLDPYYHQTKSKLAKSNGYDLIHLFEDDLLFRPEAVKHLLNYKFGLLPTVAARKCIVGRVEHDTARRFYQNFHMQGYSIAGKQKHYGLYSQGQLVAVMSFSQYSSGRVRLKADSWELVRFASSIRVQGGASRLFKSFLKEFKPTKVLSFSWNHLFNGNMYEKLGFKMEKELPPDYSYFDPSKGRRFHKAGFQRSRLKSKFKNFDPSLSERQNCENNGFHRVYDCGKRRWVWES